MFIRFDTTHERDRQTHRHRMAAKAALDASIANSQTENSAVCNIVSKLFVRT